MTVETSSRVSERIFKAMVVKLEASIQGAIGLQHAESGSVSSEYPSPSSLPPWKQASALRRLRTCKAQWCKGRGSPA
jgi:hypothetical protein